MDVENRNFIDFEGTVTSINEAYCQFTLDNIFIVLLCDVFDAEKIGMPKINEEIKLKHVILLEDSYIYLTKDSELLCSEFTFPTKSDRYVWNYVENHRFNLKDTQNIQRISEKFKKLNIFSPEFITSKTKSQDVTVDDLFLNIFTFLPTKYEVKSSDECNFNDFNFEYPSNLGIEYSDLRKRDDIDNLTYEIQRSNARQILVGYLMYDKKRFSVVLIDNKKQILCHIIHKTAIDKYINEFVIIKKYYYIAEYYKEVDEKLEYVHFILEDVCVLKLEEKLIEVECLGPYNNCNVLHKCPVFIHRFRRKIEIWVLVEFPQNKNYKCLISSPNLINIYHLINVGTKLKTIIPEDKSIESSLQAYVFSKNVELRRSFVGIKSFMLPESINLEINSDTYRKMTLQTMEDVLPNFGEQNNVTVSFSAIIQYKKLTEPLSSRTASTKTTKKIFGTPGSQTHVLTLVGINDRSYSKTIYLSNLEASLCQIGLIPGMYVNVRNALIQKSYLKSSMMTYFEPLDYKPYYEMNTRIAFTEDSNWGEPTLISSVKDNTKTVRIWICIIAAEICIIDFTSTCEHCKTIAQSNQLYCCASDDYVQTFQFTFKVSDLTNSMFISTEDKKVITIILGMTDSEFSDILNKLSNLRSFQYTPNDKNLKAQSTDDVAEIISYLDSKAKIIKQFDIRIKNTSGSFSDKWICTEVRESINT